MFGKVAMGHLKKHSFFYLKKRAKCGGRYCDEAINCKSVHCGIAGGHYGGTEAATEAMIYYLQRGNISTMLLPRTIHTKDTHRPNFLVEASLRPLARGGHEVE